MLGYSRFNIILSRLPRFPQLFEGRFGIGLGIFGVFGVRFAVACEGVLQIGFQVFSHLLMVFSQLQRACTLCRGNGRWMVAMGW
jgi:hypothetical protein